ncbi:MAG TPA: hypothetical protein VFD13_05470 [Candidatus Kapabacteria bacterium]|nr:hypothetical protein [Candidatus Kapabacteria bacterium]
MKDSPKTSIQKRQNEHDSETRLTESERAQLKNAEDEIAQNLGAIEYAFFNIGEALTNISENRLYRGEYGTFEEYIKQRWRWTRSMGYHLMHGYETRKGLPESERNLLQNIRQALALGKAPMGERADILRHLHSNGAKVTAKTISLEIEKRLGPSKLSPQTVKPRTYGNPIYFRGLRNEPINENGVVFLFGLVAKDLGFSVESVQAGFPDCDAKQEISRNKWRHVRIEFEYESKNFYIHDHDPNGCDMIVCWKHNWAECPANLEVIELSTRIKSLPQAEE